MWTLVLLFALCVGARASSSSSSPQRWYFEKINYQIRNNCTLYQDSDEGILRCRNGHRITKRQTPRPFNEFRYEDCGADIEDLLLTHEMYFLQWTLRQFNPQNPITADTSSIIDYMVLPTRTYFNDVQVSRIQLPLNVRAVITNYTLDQRRENFNSGTNINYNGMDVGLNRPVNDYDERGHMIAARLGGNAEPYNIFPQTRSMNRGTGSLWNTMERNVERWVRSDPGFRYAIMTVALSYDINSDMTIIHRPVGVAVRVEARDTRNSNYHNIDTLAAVPVGQPNPHRNMFFSNEVNSLCPTPHPAAGG